MSEYGEERATLRREPLRRPLCWTTLGLLGGQILARIIPLRLDPLGVGLAIGTYCGVRAVHPLAAVVLLAMIVGHQQVEHLLRPRLGPAHVRQLAGRGVELKASIAERPSRRDSGLRLILEVSDVREGESWRAAGGRVLVTLLNPTQRWRRGDVVRAEMRLRLPRNFGNPGEFDYESYLARQAIYITGFAEDDRSWSRVEPAGGWSGRLEAWRDGVQEAIDAAVDGPARSIVAALLIGEMGGLDRDTRDRYAATGTSHILSISGLHIGLVAAAAYSAMRWLLARSEWLLLRGNVPKLSLTMSIAPVIAYGEIAGGSSPTLRSTVMAMLLLAGTLIDRRRDWFTTVAAAAFAISTLWPGSIFDVSFQLSFAAVIGIVLGMERITRWWATWEEEQLLRLRGRGWRVLRWLVLYESVTLCAVAATAPLGAWHFNRVSIIALLANPVVVPLLGFVPVGLGLLAIFAQPVWPDLTRVLLVAIGWNVRLADRLVEIFAALPAASVRIVTPTVFELVLLYCGLATLFIPRRRLRRAVLASCLALIAADAVYWYAVRFNRGDLRVTFLSVGQGDAAVIEFPGSQTMVIDGGGISPSFDVGERIVAPYLWSRKIGWVDALVLTHAQYDHYGGLAFLAGELGAGALWWNGWPATGVRFDEFWRNVERGGVRPSTMRRGFRERIGGVDVAVLAPGDERPADPNDGSLTLRLRYGAATLLFTGDLEAAGEERLLRSDAGDLRATLLKVPHHGSRTSSSPPFLSAVAPCAAVISAGYENRFAMPHGQVLDAYRARGTAVFRTDRDGAVIATVSESGRIDLRTGRSGTHAVWFAPFCS